MIEIIIGLIISLFFVVYIALLVVFLFFMRETNREKSKLINALLAKTPEQMRDLTLADKVRPISPPSEVQSDLIPEGESSLEEWESAIHNQLEHNE
jgi:hypothetical protein